MTPMTLRRARAAAAALLCGLMPFQLAGCGNDDPASQGRPADPPPVEMPPTPPAEVPAVRGEYDVERYSLRGEYDWSRGRLAATVEITFTTLAPSTTAIALDSAVAEVKSVRSRAGAALPFTVDPEAREIAVHIASLPGRAAGDPLVVAIEYEAEAGDALNAFPARAGDPVAVRAVYTRAEPRDASLWMPCHDRPDDRAFFSVEMRMDSAEEMISNGELILDAPDGPTARRMAYETQYTLPPYLMAFAISDFEVTTAQPGDVPISLWRRAGVPAQGEAFVAEMNRQIGVFEGLLGPYPFDKYALVMLPDYPGGMENASATFQSELGAGQTWGSGDLTLSAHELGHQWFGDLITVATWDDLWIKEGMATLLSAEAMRAHEDQGATGALFGDWWYAMPGEAIRDTSLAPEDKYTGGPYARAAWLFTQIRAVVGEDAFWGTMRGLLDAHREGVVGTEDVLAAFAPALGPDAAERARRAVDALDIPTIEVSAPDTGGVLVTLHDPEGTLVAPMEIEWHREGGAVERATLVPEVPLLLQRNAPGDFLVLDPADIHPEWFVFFADDLTFEAASMALAPLRLPETAPELASFTELAGANQVAPLNEIGLPPVAPADFPAFVDSLDAESAKAVAIRAACERASLEADPAVRDAWIPVLTDELAGEPHYLGIWYAYSYQACQDLVSPITLFGPAWDELEAGLTTASLPESRVYYMTFFSLPYDEALLAWGNVARSAYSLRARSLAATALSSYARRVSQASPESLPAWRSLYAELLEGSEVSDVLRYLLRGMRGFRDEPPAENAELFDGLRAVLMSPHTRDVHGSAVCAASMLASSDAAAWADFAASLGGAPLSEAAQGYLADPTTCP